MYSVSATSTVAAATAWASEVTGIILIVLGFSVALILGNWIVAKFRARGAGKASGKRTRRPNKRRRGK